MLVRDDYVELLKSQNCLSQTAKYFIPYSFLYQFYMHQSRRQSPEDDMNANTYPRWKTFHMIFLEAFTCICKRELTDMHFGPSCDYAA